MIILQLRFKKTILDGDIFTKILITQIRARKFHTSYSPEE